MPASECVYTAARLGRGRSRALLQGKKVPLGDAPRPDDHYRVLGLAAGFYRRITSIPIPRGTATGANVKPCFSWPTVTERPETMPIAAPKMTSLG